MVTYWPGQGKGPPKNIKRAQEKVPPQSLYPYLYRYFSLPVCLCGRRVHQNVFRFRCVSECPPAKKKQQKKLYLYPICWGVKRGGVWRWFL